MKKTKKPSHKTAPKKQVKAKSKPVQKPAKKAPKKVAVKKPKPVAKPSSKPVAKPAAKKVVKPIAKPVSKIVAKPAVKPIVKAPVKKIMIPVKPLPPKIDEPKPKGLYSLEYELNSSPDVLFEFISTPGGLEKWFADRVYIIEGNFVFNWEDGEKRLARQVGLKDKEWVRFHWLDEPEKRYFEFKIVIDDLTREVALIVSDFADSPKELEESTRLWNQQIHDLHHNIGSA
jgi:START-like superfamily domain